MSEYNVSTSNCNQQLEQHVHEVVGSTVIAGQCDCAHNHRFATVSGEAIPYQGSHVHKIKFRTDSFDEHYHEFSGQSSVAIPVGDGRHVHFVNACTDSADGHSHEFRVATLIDDPTEK